MAGRWVAVSSAAIVALLALIGAIGAIPSSKAALSYRDAVEAARSGDWDTAKRLSREVLSRYPKAAIPREILACALRNEGKDSLAAINVYKAVADGLVLSQQGSCGGKLDLSDAFKVAPVGFADFIVVYSGPGHAPAVGRALDKRLSDGERLLNAACAGMNNNLVAFGVEALNTYQLEGYSAGPEVDTFFRRCLQDYASWFTCEPLAKSAEIHCFLAWDREMTRRRELASL